jgi:hypothetical protein
VKPVFVDLRNEAPTAASQSRSAFVRYFNASLASDALARSGGSLAFAGRACAVGLATEAEHAAFWARKLDGMAAARERDAERAASGAPASAKRGGGGSRHAAENRLFPVNEDLWQEIKTFYELDDAFPRERLFCRSEGHKSVSVISPAVKELCIDTMRGVPVHRGLKVVHTGLQLFERHKVAGVKRFRVMQQGLGIVIRHMRGSKRLVRLACPQFLDLLARHGKQLDFSVITDADVRARVEALELGSFVVQLDTSGLTDRAVREQLDRSAMHLCAWKGKSSFSIMAKQEHVHSLLAALEYTRTVRPEHKPECFKEVAMIPRTEEIDAAVRAETHRTLAREEQEQEALLEAAATGRL